MRPSPSTATFWLTFAAGVGWAAWLLYQSTGAALDDEIGHYLVARDSWHEPRLLLNPWGRCLNTLIYALPATLGLDATRWFSLILTCTTVGLAYRLARHLSLQHAYLIVPFLWFQRWTLELSTTCLTEIPFMLFLVWGLERFAAGRLLATGLLIGSLPLIRHEGIALAGLWVGYAILIRRWRLALALILPSAAYNLACFAALGSWPFAIFFEPKPTDEYGSGGWLHFAPLLVRFAGVPLLLLASFGLPVMARTRERSMAMLTFAAYLLIHVLIFRFGLFASGGYAEFLVPIAPGLAIVAVAGVDWLGERLAASAPSLQRRPTGETPRPIRPFSIAGLTLVVVLTGIMTSERTELRPIESACLEAAAWLRDRGLDRRPITATNVWLYHGLPLRLKDPELLWTAPTPVEDTPVGTIVVWDRKYSELWGLRLESMLGDSAHWTHRADFGSAQEVIVFERTN